MAMGPLIAPRVRPALAFRIARPIPINAAPADIDTATGAMAPAIDITDRRWRGDAVPTPNMVADNAFAGTFAVGTWRALPDALNRIALTLTMDPPVAASSP